VQTLILQIDKNTFLETIPDSALKALHISEHMQKDHPIHFFDYNLPISIAQRRIIDELINCPANSQCKAGQPPSLRLQVLYRITQRRL
jgi:hypothetical protein